MQSEQTQGKKIIPIQFDVETMMGQLAPYTCTAAAVCELIDNSIDAGASRIFVDYTEDRLKVSDNGKGLDYNTIENLYHHVKQEHAEGDLGKFAAGSKTAREYLAGHAKGSHLYVSKVVDENSVNLATLNDRLEIEVEKSYDLETHWEALHPDSITPDSGVVCIYKDVKNVDKNDFVSELQALKQHIGITYYYIMERRGVTVFLNGKEIEPINIVGDQYLPHFPPQELVYRKQKHADRKLTLSLCKAPAKKNQKDESYAGVIWVRNERVIAWGGKHTLPYLLNPNYPAQAVIETRDDFDNEFNMTPGKELPRGTKPKPKFRNFLKEHYIKPLHEICNVAEEEEPEIEFDSSFNKDLNRLFWSAGIIGKHSPVQRTASRVSSPNGNANNNGASSGNIGNSGSKGTGTSNGKGLARGANQGVHWRFEKMGRANASFYYAVDQAQNTMTITLNSSKRMISRLKKDKHALQDYAEEEIVPSILAAEEDEKVRAAQQKLEHAISEKRMSIEECRLHKWSNRILEEAVKNNAVLQTWYSISEIAQWVAKDFPKVVKYKNNGLKQIKAELRSNFLSPTGIKKKSYENLLKFKRDLNNKKVCFL